MKGKELEKYIKLHPYKISYGKNGYWTTYLPLPDGRKKISKKTEKEILIIVADFWKEEEDNPYIYELFKQWNEERLDDEMISRRSYDRYNQVFKRHFGDIDNKKIKSITIEQIIKFLKTEKKEKKLGKKSFNLLKSTVIGILETADDMNKLSFDYICFQNELHKNVRKMKFTPKVCDDSEEVFSEEEYAVIVSYLRENLDTKNIALLLMFVTGMRIGELVAIKNNCIMDGYIRICRSETRYENPDGEGYIYEVQEHPKTEKGFRNIFLPEDYAFLLKKMKQLNPSGEYVFCNKKGERFTVNVISRRLNTVCKKLGINPKSPHKVRKTVGTILFDANLDKKLILNQMGWNTEAVGEIHYHRNRKNNDKKINILSSIPEFKV